VHQLARVRWGALVRPILHVLPWRADPPWRDARRRGVRGLLALLDEKGMLSINYLGTDPPTSAVVPADSALKVRSDPTALEG
jgi:hypothetical protein